MGDGWRRILSGANGRGTLDKWQRCDWWFLGSYNQPPGQVYAKTTDHLSRSLQRLLVRYTQLICQTSSSGRHPRGNPKGKGVEKENDFDLRGGVQINILEGCQRSQLCGMPEEGADLITQGDL